jgi:hypothetical protein
MEQLIPLQIAIDPEGYRDMERVKAFLGSPNPATALMNAVSILSTLYQYQSQGYELRLVKNGDVRRFRLPTT